jgi:putative membrane protein
MKSSKLTSFPTRHRALVASAMIMLVGAATAAAQSGSAGSTSTGSTPKNPPSDASATSSSTSGSTYNSDRTSTAAAATTTGDTTSVASTGKLSWTDRRFVTKAADEGQDEVTLAQLAAQRATNSEVRSFAQKLADDHTTVNAELMTIASQKNVKVDKDGDKDRAYKRLSKKTGSDFDQEFVEHMIDEHEKDIKMFEKAAKDAKDSDVRSFASKHVDHLRQHLQQAQSLRQTLMPTGRMDNSSGRSTTGLDTSTTPSSTPGTYNSGTSATSGTSGTTGSSTDTSGTSSSTTPKRDGSR